MAEPETSLHKSTQSDYCVELMARLNIQRQRGNFCDVTIMVEGREFKAHRSVLSAVSPFFDSMFTCNMKEKGQDSVCLEEIDVSVMEYILDFMYTGDVLINQANAQDLMVTANYLLLPSLKSRAAAFLHQSLDISNCIRIYYFGAKYEFQDLVCSAREFINSNFMSVSETEDFMELSHLQVKEWISSDDIIIGGEIGVFKIVLKWIGNDESSERESNFPELFQSIRLTLVSRDHFFADIMKSKLVRENPGCLDAVLDAAGEVAQMSGEYLPRQKPRKCLEKHEDAIVICGETRNLCYLPSHNSWYQLASRLSEQKYVWASSCRGCLYTSTERYDPQVNSWSAIASPPQDGKFMTAVALLGCLYLIGGVNKSTSERLGSTYRYDPDSNSWQQVASLSSPRSSVCAVADDKFIYAIGGISVSNVYLNTVDRFDPGATTWTPLAPMTEQRSGACGVLLRGNIFVFGGRQQNTYLRSCEKYSCALNHWQLISNIHMPRSVASAVAFEDTVYVFGGLREKSFESYDRDSDTWEQKGTMPVSLGRCSAGALRFCKTVLDSCTPLSSEEQ